MFQTQIIKKQLHFKQPAGTSRGVYTTRNVWYILLTDTGSRHYGVGECAPLPALSCDCLLYTSCRHSCHRGHRNLVVYSYRMVYSGRHRHHIL